MEFSWSGAIFALLGLHALAWVAMAVVGVRVMNAHDEFRKAARRLGGQLGHERLERCDTGVALALSLAMLAGVLLLASILVVYYGWQAMADAAAEQYAGAALWMLGSFVLLAGWTAIAWVWRRRNADFLKELDALSHRKRVLYHRKNI